MEERKINVKKLVRKVRKKQERKFKITLKRLEVFKNSSSSKVIEQFYARRNGKKKDNIGLILI